MLTLENISKSFGAVQALDKASLTLVPGEIRAFLGANGSGKSTIVKILSGLVKKDEGTVLLDNKTIDITSPHISKAFGIAAAYQDLSLVSYLSVRDNLLLGHEPIGKTGMIGRKEAWDIFGRYLDMLGAKIDPDTLVSTLDLSIQNIVEIAKALTWKPSYLLLDEITASLYQEQVDVLFSLLKKVASEGVSILFVTHRLEEVFRLCDSATILRSGKTVASMSLSGVDECDLIYHMTGKKVEAYCHSPTGSTETKKTGIPVLKTNKLTIRGRFSDVSLCISEGEIVGVAGLQGQGQAEFLRSVYGYYSYDEGTMEFRGRQVKFRIPAEAVAAGFGFIPGDREHEGIFHVRPVYENIFSARFSLMGMLRWLNPKNLVEAANDIIKKLNVVTAGPEFPANSLSGGNQQKLVIGRWLVTNPKVLLLDDPTKGVDISSRREIHDLLRDMAKKNTAILFSSSDNEELLEIAERIVVFYEGRIIAELVGTDISEENLSAAILGKGTQRGDAL